VEAVHHLEVHAQVLLGQVVQHARVHQTLHEVRAVLRQAQARQPLVADPLVVHVAVGQRLGPVATTTATTATTRDGDRQEGKREN